MKIAVFVSGNGSNLQCIIDNCKSKEIEGIEISIVIADRNCYAIQRAKNEKIDWITVDRKENWQQKIHILLKERKVEFIVLAGFLSILESNFCSKWENKIINIHPSLLPKYGGIGMYGLKVHQSVIDNKEKESGATVHFVTHGIDEGDIILQEKIDIKEDTTAASLQELIHPIEHRLLINSLKLIHAKAQSTH
jgi:phosphoribosylglycinamide formyltransferase-1